jgi:hypothetical protein
MNRILYVLQPNGSSGHVVLRGSHPPEVSTGQLTLVQCSTFVLSNVFSEVPALQSTNVEWKKKMV